MMTMRMMMTYYLAIEKSNQLLYGTGNAVIVSGWTPAKYLANLLHHSNYAAIGQLYSPTRGISLLIRNLLYNPQIDRIFVLNATKEDENAGACQCLYDFFNNGVRRCKTDTGREVWVIESQIKGYIDIEIALGALVDLMSKISVHFFEETNQLVKDVIDYNNSSSKIMINHLDRLIFPKAETTKQQILPGTRYGHRIEGKTIAETWVKILHRIKKTGTIRPTGYDGYWQELIDLIAIVTDEPDDFYFPEPNYLPIDRDYLDKYIPQILNDAPIKEGVKYTYGQRLRSWFEEDQIEQCIEKLVREIDAASAVMSLWDVQDHNKGGSPCLNHIWVRVVDNELSLTATFRSNDMFAAWPANAMGLRALQVHIKNEINTRSNYSLDLGPLITISQSAHIYDDTWENVDVIIKKHYKQNKSYNDAVGNFLVEKNGNQIFVTQTDLQGNTVNSYTGKSALLLINKIAHENPGIDPKHIGYLGIELQRAAISETYIQQ